MNNGEAISYKLSPQFDLKLCRSLCGKAEKPFTICGFITALMLPVFRLHLAIVMDFNQEFIKLIQLFGVVKLASVTEQALLACLDILVAACKTMMKTKPDWLQAYQPLSGFLRKCLLEH